MVTVQRKDAAQEQILDPLPSFPDQSAYLGSSYVQIDALYIERVQGLPR